MYFANLPAKITSGEKKGQDAVVTITNNGKLVENQNVEFEIPQASFEYPQFGPDPRSTDAEGKVTERELTDEEARAGIEEFIQNAGSAVRALEIINDATKTAAVNGGKNKVRVATTGTREAIIEMGLKTSREFTWAAVERVTTAKIRDTLDQIKSAGVDEIPADQLREMLKRLIK